MKRIPDGSVDCVICDLPYGTTKNEWDNVIPLKKLWSHYKRVVKERGAIILFSQMPFTAVLACSNIGMFRYEIIWEKESATGFLNCNFAPMKKHENILVFSHSSACFVHSSKKTAMIYNPQMSTGHKPYVNKHNSKRSTNYGYNSIDVVTTVSNGERYPTDIVYYARDKEKLHPTQKPVALIQYLIRTCSNEGDTILDNCMGSGTTAVACMRENRNYIGFELNKEYYDMCCRRIEKERQQPRLFLNNGLIMGFFKKEKKEIVDVQPSCAHYELKSNGYCDGLTKAIDNANDVAVMRNVLLQFSKWLRTDFKELPFMEADPFIDDWCNGMVRDIYDRMSDITNKKRNE